MALCNNQITFRQFRTHQIGSMEAQKGLVDFVPYILRSLKHQNFIYMNF